MGDLPSVLNRLDEILRDLRRGNLRGERLEVRLAELQGLLPGVLPQLEAALTSPDESRQVKLWLMSTITIRKDPEAVATLVRLLSHEDPEVSERAASGLAAIGT